MTDRTINIFLADDHTIVRQGLAKLIEAEPNFKVIGEAEDGRQAVSRVERLNPDIVIMDIAMPLLNGIEATRQIKKLSPQTKVIILLVQIEIISTTDYYFLVYPIARPYI